MQRKRSPISLVAMMLALASCTFLDDGSWREEWGTPELFLANVVGHRYVYGYEDQGQFQDEDFAIRDLIQESGPFESTSRSSATVSRYFTYEGYWQPATSGPNYCHMSIWDDGLVQIHHKKSLGPHCYVYYQMDAGKAINLNDVVFDRLAELQESESALTLVSD